jgi:hypothetical protein
LVPDGALTEKRPDVLIEQCDQVMPVMCREEDHKIGCEAGSPWCTGGNQTALWAETDRVVLTVQSALPKECSKGWGMPLRLAGPSGIFLDATYSKLDLNGRDSPEGVDACPRRLELPIWVSPFLDGSPGILHELVHEPGELALLVGGGQERSEARNESVHDKAQEKDSKYAERDGGAPYTS